MRKAERAETTRTARSRETASVQETPSWPDAVNQNVDNMGSQAFSQQTVWYRLMKLTNLINRPFFSRYAERYHLTINDARVLLTLSSMQEAASHELCDATGMHPMNVSRSVATLRRQGRIAERRDPDNRRRKILKLTPKGWALCRTFLPEMNRMAEFLFASMSPLEREFLSRLVDLLICRLESVNPSTRAPRDSDNLAEHAEIDD